jgi:hypothetical protein
VSTGHPAITAGTIGARVTDGTDVFALSNNHVYADVNAASIGDAVIQPGTFDDGSSPDAATAATVGNATPGDGTPKSATVAASVNQKVKKYGRTTGLSKGQVYVINATVNVCYEADAAGNCTKLASFVDQIVITPGSFSAGGDSGSLIVADGKGRNKADDRKPVGLLFAGSALVTIADPIDAVLAAFNVTIDGD